MRRSLASCLLLLLCGGPLPAAGAPASPAGPAGDKAQAEEFARQLVYVCNQIGDHYVRPVPPAELVGAALRGLYEAARVPVPAGLAAELERCKSGEDLCAVLARARADLGDPEPLRGHGAMLVACGAMAKSLDPYTAVVNGEDLRRGNGVDDRQGVGLELEENFGAGPLRVKTVLPGGPAQVAGIRPGDEITHIDSEPVKDLTSDMARLRLNRGEVITILHPTVIQQPSISLTVGRPGGAARKFTLERREFRPETVLGVVRREDNSWDYMLDPKEKIAHVRLGALGNTTAYDMRVALTALQEAGMRGLILDLRGCPGGYLREAVNVAALFLGECTVATVKHRGQPETTYPSTRENKFLDFPVVVLVNGETSGGAELIAAALQDHQRAAVVGQRTLGKASIQTMLALPAPDAGLKLTSGTFVRPSGKNLHRSPDSTPRDDWGVRPDPGLESRVSPELGRQLKEWWVLQTLRPGTSKEALPLDRPDADPQRHAAVQALLDRMK
jgi:C-terminal peptidase prc